MEWQHPQRPYFPWLCFGLPSPIPQHLTTFSPTLKPQMNQTKGKGPLFPKLSLPSQTHLYPDGASLGLQELYHTYHLWYFALIYFHFSSSLRSSVQLTLFTLSNILLQQTISLFSSIFNLFKLTLFLPLPLFNLLCLSFPLHSSSVIQVYVSW